MLLAPLSNFIIKTTDPADSEKEGRGCGFLMRCVLILFLQPLKENQLLRFL